MKTNFSHYQDVFDYIKSNDKSAKPIIVVLLGTNWSPICKYSFHALKELVDDPEYGPRVQPFFINQDSHEDAKFCHSEDIPIGFPVLLIFVNSYLTRFTPRGSSFDPSHSEQKTRLVCQLNLTKLKKLVDGAIAILNEQASTIVYDDY